MASDFKQDIFIKNYNAIRDILRNHYIFGFYTKKDYEELGIKSRTFERYQKRLNYFLPGKFLSKRTKDRRVIHFCSYDMYSNNQNLIVNTFKAKNFVDQDIKVYFYLLQLLNEGSNSELGLSDFCRIAPSGMNKVFTKQSVDHTFKDLEEYGYIVSSNKKYKLKEDILSDLTDEEVEDIYTLLEIVKESVSFEVPFFLLKNKLEMYLKYEREKDDLLENFFLTKHGHLFNVIDNEIVYKLLKAISKKSAVEIDIKNRNGKKSIQTIPVKIIHDLFYGRQYLLGYSEKFKNFSTYRIDNIEDVKNGEILDIEKLNIIIDKSKEEELCWCTSLIYEPKNTLVKIEFRFDENRERFILERIKKEGSNGVIKKVDKNKYLYEIYVKDPREMIPWIRSFGERAKVIESGDYKIEEQILSNWKELLKKYGAV